MFQIFWPSLVTLALGASLAGCASTQSPAESAPAAPSATAETEAGPSARPQLTAEDCTAQGGTVVGDIGDGAIHRPDYRCPSGAEPSGTITSSGDGPISVEGSVCCPG